MAQLIPRQSARRRLFKRFMGLLALNAAGSIVGGGLFWWFVGHGVGPEFWGYFGIAMVYSNTYGLLLGLTMPDLGPKVMAFRRPWNWILMAVTLVTLTAVGALIIGLILIGIGYQQPDQVWRNFTYEAASGSVISLLVGISIAVYQQLREKITHTMLRLRTQELEKERALKLAVESRLASLESRLHPHFLFNTLNSISALIREDTHRADHMVQRLATLLRACLDASMQRLIPLALELKLVRDYLEIEKERFRERISYTIEMPPELEQTQVPPLSIQTLVENSVKHAIAPFPEGGAIRVSAKTTGELLLLEIWDSGPGFDLENITAGRGLDNLQSRLTTLFGDASSLCCRRLATGFLVTIRLPRNVHEVVER